MKKALICVALLALVGVVAWKLVIPGRPKHVIFIVLDTLRPDHLGGYGYERDTSPTLDQFAKEGLHFRYAITSAPWTPPALASMFTGKYVSSHGLMPPNGRDIAKRNAVSLNLENNTIPEILAAQGYQTLGVTSNPWLGKEFGFDQGFQEYYCRPRARADEINRATHKLLDKLDVTKPFFLFVHYLDPHDPYEPPAPYDQMYTGTLKNQSYSEKDYTRINAYDGEIRYLDDRLKELIEDLKAHRVWDDSLIIIISDHGEQFGERGEYGHGFRLFNEELRVVLMIRGPGIQPRDVQEIVSHVDIVPTILDFAGIESKDKAVIGVSLLNEHELKQRPGVLSEINRIHNLKSFTSQDRKRIILDYGEDGGAPTLVGLFDTRPELVKELPVADEQASKEFRLEFDSLFERASENIVKSAPMQMKQETLEQLKSLGYAK